MTLIEELLKKELLSKEKAAVFESEVKNLGKKEEEVLLSHKAISEEDLFNLKSEILKIPLKKIDPEDVPREILDLIPEDSASYYQIVPLAKKEGIV